MRSRGAHFLYRTRTFQKRHIHMQSAMETETHGQGTENDERQARYTK